MQSAVDRILEGKFNTEHYSLSFEPPVIELTIPFGEDYEGSFSVLSDEAGFVEGTISSSNLSVQCPISTFSGDRIDIPFIIPKKGLATGSEIRGEFRVISNQGEYCLPYNIKVGHKDIDTSVGSIRNLFHFTNLARTSWSDAVRLFESDKLEYVLGGTDSQHINTARMLKEAYEPSQALEEFLLFVKKKQSAEFIVEEPNIRIESPYGNVGGRVIINRNGWGYSTLDVQTDSSFIRIEKNRISDEDFPGNRAVIPYTIIKDELHEGRAYGEIILKNAYNDIHVKVVVINNPVNRKLADLNRESKHLIVDMMKYYQAFRCHKISSQSWVEPTIKIIDELRELEPSNISYQLMNVQVLITQERYNEAAWVLEQLAIPVEQTHNDAIRCYYYYLTTLVNRNPEHTEEVIELVKDIYDCNHKDWRIAWLMLYLSEEYARQPLLRWECLKEQFEMGSTSPFIYVEAYQALINNPTIMTTMSEFEIQVLRFMDRMEVLSADVIDQFIYLISQYKNCNSHLLGLLKSCYRVNPNDDVLKALVALLINTGHKDQDAFEWYSLAVERNVRVTRLYEYYMMSVDMDADIEIPRMVLMYFSFDSTLDNEHNAYLYAYVLKHRAQMPEIYENYREAIERFVSFQLLNGHNNKFLAILYRGLLTESMITEDVARGLKTALFVHRIVTKRPNIVKVIVRYESMVSNVEFEVTDMDRIFIPIYGNHMSLALVDADNNEYIQPEDYVLERLMVPDKYSRVLKPLVDDIYFDQWICLRGKDIVPVDRSNVAGMERLATSGRVCESVRQKINVALIRFYFEHDMIDELDNLLSSLDISDIANEDISEVIKNMAQRQMYDRAYDYLVYSSGQGVDSKILLKILSRVLFDMGPVENIDEADPVFLALAYQSYRNGKYDEPLVKYLVKFISLSSKELRDIWRTAVEYNLDTTRIEEIILEQVLYTGAYVPGISKIFSSYLNRHADENLTLAYLSQICFDFFVNDKVIDDDYIDALTCFIAEDVSIPLVCKLAYTKYYADKDCRSDERIMRTLMQYLREIMLKGMYFAYFKNYAKDIAFLHRFQDKTIIEYHAQDGNKALIRYMVEKPGSSDEYVKEEMKEMFYGICVKSFVLFFGERLQYYIIEENRDSEVLTESGTLSHNDMDEGNNISRYSMINDIAISRTLGDYGTMDRYLTEFFVNEYITTEIFRMSE